MSGKSIAELVADNFFGTMAKLAHAQGCSFSAESVAPVMTSDGMLHFGKVDIPMGEFWLRSPTHDKPNDILDAISGGHIYGKNIIQAEAFTELRLMWDEHPALLKALADRNFALGINRFVFHVNVLNPWLDRKPGMTLDGIGTFFQRDQTWWKQGKAWVQYLARCQALLQMGHPVTDVAVFTGEETPRRAILPDRLVSALPGIFGSERVKEEALRLANIGEPMRTIPDGVTSSANMADADKWVNPLRGYAYDSFNLDALLRLATVKNGRIILPGGANYGVLVLPGSRPMSPGGTFMSPQAARRLQQLVHDGATVITGHYKDSTFNKLGITRDVTVTDSAGKFAGNVGWNHRAGKGFDIYFISNQNNEARKITISLRTSGCVPELWDPLTGDTRIAGNWKIQDGRTVLPLKLDASGSMFIVLKKPATKTVVKNGANWPAIKPAQTLKETWMVKFDKAFGGPQKPIVFNGLFRLEPK